MTELTKKERHLQDLRKYSLSDESLKSYLLQNSNLPGKRGNIELAFSFGDFIEEIYASEKSRCFQYCLDLISEYDENKNEYGNEEFLPFCAIIALGRIAKNNTNKQDEILVLLKGNAKDERWRIREAVAMALQDLLDVYPSKIIDELKKWISEKNYLIHRAIVAGLAEPRFMKNEDIAKVSFEIHKHIIRIVEDEKDVKDKDFNVLVKGLCYTLSVIITGIQDDGFDYLEELANKKNPVVKKIVRENLKKNRLKLLNENKVSALQEKLSITV